MTDKELHNFQLYHIHHTRAWLQLIRSAIDISKSIIDSSDISDKEKHVLCDMWSSYIAKLSDLYQETPPICL